MKMEKDLTVSGIERQNILNNRIAVDAIRQNLELPAMLFNNEYCFTKQMVAEFYDSKGSVGIDEEINLI